MLPLLAKRESVWFGRGLPVLDPGGVTLFAALRTVCVSTVWSPSRGCVVADRSVARFCGLRNFLHDLSSHVSGTGALVATSDVSCVKLLRELKSWRHILLVSHGVLLWLGAWCAVAKKFVSYGKLWRELICRLRLGVSPWLGKWSVVVRRPCQLCEALSVEEADSSPLVTTS